MAVFRFSLPTVVCSACTPAIEKALKTYQDQVKSKQSAALSDKKKYHITDFDVDYVTKILTVEIAEENASYQELLQIINNIVDEVGHRCESLAKLKSNKPQTMALQTTDFWYSHWFQGLIGIISGLIILCLPLFPFIVPFYAAVGIAISSVVLTLLLGAPFYLRAKKQLQNREPAMDLLFALSTTIVITVSCAAFFLPWLPMMFETGLLIFGFRHLGLAIRDSIISKTFSTHTTFQSRVPAKVMKVIKNDDKTCHVETPLIDIQPGDEIIIFPGEMVPIDGVCILPTEIAGSAKNVRLLGTATIDGNTLPREIMNHDAILAGMRLLPNEKSVLMKVTGRAGYVLQWHEKEPPLPELATKTLYLYMQHNKLCCIVKNQVNQVQRFVLQDSQLTDQDGINHTAAIRSYLKNKNPKKNLPQASFDQLSIAMKKQGYPLSQLDSYLKRLDQGIAQAERTKSSVVKQTAQIAKYFIPATLVLSALTGVVIGCFFPLTMALNCAISVLVAACPCTWGLIIPLVEKTAIQKAGRYGIRINHAQVLEDLRQVNRVFFDLSGTLTTGQLAVDWQQSKQCCEEMDETEFLSYFAALESHATHPIGQAIVDFIQKTKKIVPHNMVVESLDKSHHAGLMGVIAGKKYLIGNQSLLQTHGIRVPPEIEQKTILQSGDRLVYLVQEQKILGYLVVNDPLRKDAIQTIKLLQANGYKPGIITGMDKTTALRYAKTLNIEPKDVFADCLGVPDAKNQDQRITKKACISALQKKGDKILFVGDGANDLPAMKVAYANMAMKHRNGDELTEQRASAVLASGALRPVLMGLIIAKQRKSNIYQNFSFSLLYNIFAELIAGGVFLTIGIVISPGLCVSLMIIQTCLILLNAYRFQHQPVIFKSPPSFNTTAPKANVRTSSYSHILRKTPINVKQASPPTKPPIVEPSNVKPSVDFTSPPTNWIPTMVGLTPF